MIIRTHFCKLLCTFLEEAWNLYIYIIKVCLIRLARFLSLNLRFLLSNYQKQNGYQIVNMFPYMLTNGTILLIETMIL